MTTDPRDAAEEAEIALLEDKRDALNRQIDEMRAALARKRFNRRRAALIGAAGGVPFNERAERDMESESA